ncbi:MAG: hypothetical protein MUF54_21525 [Polyangiaceae bacterium]|jgi:uncharacterized membrane protein|nr:hypothetical protein [Polyangiaceae bacterium]
MVRYVVQTPDGTFAVVDAPSPRAAAIAACATTDAVIVWYRTRHGWASWAETTGSRTRYAGKVDARVAALLGDVDDR